MRKKWERKVGVFIAVFLTCFIGWYLNDPPEPERCALCDHIKCHGPCLVNLATGEVGEVEIYEPHRKKVGEIAPEQEGGRLTFLYPAGVSVRVLTPPWTAEFSVSAEKKRLNKAEFCRGCRKLLSGVEGGHVLADLYDPEHPVIYRIQNGAEYDIRCYRIFITWVEQEYEININGLL